MEKEREKREKLFWELQMLKSGQSRVSDGVNTQTLSENSSIRHNKKRNKKPCDLSSLLRRARRLYVRLDVDGVWSLLPSLSHSHVNSKRLSLISPTKLDVLLLLEYKYDIIKERLYIEMLQEEHGVGWLESVEPLEQTDCVYDLEQRAEEALKQSDVLCVCELPGVLHCYRSADGVKEQVWTSSPQGQSWTSAIFLSELRSHCDQERRSLTQLLNRVERLVLTEIYLSVFVGVRRAERETHSHTALLTSRQHWEDWPCLRCLDVEDLVKFWLQEKQDESTQLRNECTTSRCVRQAVLQCLVQCQEQERKTLVEILHTVSQEELQEQRDTITPDTNTAGITDLRRGCVSILKQIKFSLQSSSTHSASWDDCAVHLLIQLTHTHHQEVQTVIHTLPVMDAAALLVLLHKYELELRSPKLHNLHILLQTSCKENTQSNISVNNEQRRSSSSVTEEHEICTGCGVVLAPDDAPYLEILGVGEKKNEERREESEGEEAGREKREGDEEERRDGREQEKERERREREEEERREGRKIEDENKRKESEGEVERERKSEDKEKRRKQKEIEEENTREEREGEEERKVDAVEKQASLITLAWSKPANNNTQEVTSDLPEAQTTEDIQNEIVSDEHRTSSAGLKLDSESLSGDTHTQGAARHAVCDEQQLQREATMRSLVNIQRRAEQRWQRDRDRQILRVQERLSIIHNRKSDEDLLGLRREETFRHLANTLQQEDEQQQKMLVREKLQQLWRERSYVLQSRRERNTTEFKELLTPTAQCASNVDDVLDSHTPQHVHTPRHDPTRHRSNVCSLLFPGPT
ncbi:golgin subfamily A member 6-like protein 22 [Tachysurus vachellii]|uniref:golgin subfamily A member 6-like protein 22 n=1 Tax=Tachysurus vachellii TaxID=175792 RepID=UPI00296AB5CD|nr:golgin subfamily A member 6-like protein 22 [Tachysurus vachellii]